MGFDVVGLDVGEEVCLDVVGFDDDSWLGSLEMLGSMLGEPEGSVEILGADDTLGSMLPTREGSLLTLGLDVDADVGLEFVGNELGADVGFDVVGLDDGEEVGFNVVGASVGAVERKLKMRMWTGLE